MISYKKLFIIGFIFVLGLSIEVMSENCEFNGWVIPNISPEGTIFLNGSWWTVQEFSIENGVMRKLDRLDVEPPESGQLLPIGQAIDLATQFLEENRNALGISESIEIIIEQTTNYPLSLTLFNFDQQYCNGVPVINSFAGILTVGEIGVYSLGFMWYPSFSIENTNPTISVEDASEIANSESKPKLKILPKEDNNFKLIWDVNGTYIDALNGDILNKDDSEEKYDKNIYKWIIFIAIIILTIVVGLLIKR